MTNEEKKTTISFERGCFIAEMVCLLLSFLYLISDLTGIRFLLACVMNFIAWFVFFQDGTQSKMQRGEDPLS